MARRMFTVVDVVELLRHWQAGDNVSQMGRAWFPELKQSPS